MKELGKHTDAVSMEGLKPSDYSRGAGHTLCCLFLACRGPFVATVPLTCPLFAPSCVGSAASPKQWTERGLC